MGYTSVAGLWYKPTRVPVDEFIKRFRIYREIAKRNAIESENILRIKFEELVTDYKKTLDKILRFLCEDKSVHVHPKKYFDPAISIKNLKNTVMNPVNQRYEPVESKN